jgi:tetratricopeptide (TPR) repeat protein
MQEVESSSSPASEQAPHWIEPGGPLSGSRIWHLQRRFFEQQGIEAWRRGLVSCSWACNPFTARWYARLVLAFLRDRLPAGPQAAEGPLTVVELGAGCGRFTFYMLRELGLLLAACGLGSRRLRYVATDGAASNLSFLRRHTALKPFVEAGQLDFARFDLERDRQPPLALADGPVILIANDLFGGAPQDLFRRAGGRLFELLVRAASDRHEPDLDDPGLLARIRLFFQPCPARAGHYGNPAWDRLLEDSGPGAEGVFSLPVAALRCLDLFRERTGDLLVLSADRGPLRPTEAVSPAPPRLRVHGGVSLPVNFHALGRYVREAGGRTFEHGGSELAVVAYAFGDGPALRLERAFAAMARLGPINFLQLESSAGPPSGLEEMLARLRLAAWDPEVFLRFLPRLQELLRQAPIPLKRRWRDAVERVWDNDFSLGGGDEEDLAFAAGLALGELGVWRRAAELYTCSLARHGDDAYVLFNQGLCSWRAGRHREALASVGRALALDPAIAHGRELARAIRKDLERDRSAEVPAEQRLQPAPGMLRIRDGQMRVFSEALARRFEDEAARHLAGCFPEECAALGAGLRDHVRQALERARGYGIRSRLSLLKYLNLTMVYGRTFDTNPGLAWMAAYLLDEKIPDPAERVSRLYQAALARLATEAENRRLKEEWRRGG